VGKRESENEETMPTEDEKLDGHITTTQANSSRGTIEKKGDQLLQQPKDADNLSQEDVHEDLS
jgi:hypothetical protein